VVARDLIFAADVSSGSWFRLAETVLASLAKFVAACCTAAIDGSLDEELDDDPNAALAVPPVVLEDVDPFAIVDCPEDAFAVVDCPEDALAVVDCPDEAFAVVESEFFEVASVLTSLKSTVVLDGADVASLKSTDPAPSLESAAPLKSKEVTWERVSTGWERVTFVMARKERI
jgi:hypothetical protein